MINFKSLILFLIIINLFLSAYWLIQGDIHYDVDVSRDFLVMDDMIRNRHLTLLGPRSGAIPGIFHGPLWFYVNLPVFFIGGGNPLAIGWFWFFLSALFLMVVFWVAKKLFDERVALFSVLLLSVNSIINPSIGLKNFYNPYGAVFLTPIFFWWFYQYITYAKAKDLVISLFILGLVIQFQMAFGVPILLIITIFVLIFLFRKKKLLHIFSYLILLMPLSSFIIFDLKHSGLQFQAIMQYLNQQQGVSLNILDRIFDRLRSLVFDFFDLFSPGKNLFTILLTIYFLAAYKISFKKSVGDSRKVYKLFCYLFLGFWVISLFYPGGIGNYAWPFLPLVIIIFSSFYNYLNRRIFLIAFILVYLINLYAGVLAIVNSKADINKRGPHSWAFNFSVAKTIYQDAKGDFGYFTFSPDRFAYQQRYSMIYAKKLFPNLNSFSFVKKPTTYLIEVDPPQDRPELNATNWRINDIKIEHQPDKAFRLDFILVEKYLLNEDQLRIPVNPYLLDSVFTR